MNRSLSSATLSGAAAAVLMFGPGVSQSSAAPLDERPEPAPAPVDELARFDSNSSARLSTAGTDEAAAAICTFYTKGDYAHRSSTGFAASAHGWWTNVNCRTSSAKVTVWLQQYYSDGVWRTKATGTGTWAPGGGAGNRTTARALCADSRSTGWRSVVDVDLVGLADDRGRLTTSAVNLACRRA